MPSAVRLRRCHRPWNVTAAGYAVGGKPLRARLNGQLLPRQGGTTRPKSCRATANRRGSRRLVSVARSHEPGGWASRAGPRSARSAGASGRPRPAQQIVRPDIESHAAVRAMRAHRAAHVVAELGTCRQGDQPAVVGNAVRCATHCVLARRSRMLRPGTSGLNSWSPLMSVRLLSDRSAAPPISSGVPRQAPAACPARRCAWRPPPHHPPVGRSASQPSGRRPSMRRRSSARLGREVRGGAPARLHSAWSSSPRGTACRKKLGRLGRDVERLVGSQP